MLDCEQKEDEMRDVKGIVRRAGRRLALGLLLTILCSWVAAAAESGTFTVTLTAKGLAFDQTTVTVPAGAAVTLHFVNDDSGIPHNVAIYETSAAAKVIFQGKRITGLQAIDYTFTAPSRPGTYFFRCDVHPAKMTGAFVVVPAMAVELTASQMAFDKGTIAVPAGGYVTVHFSNQDSGTQHNFAVYDSPSAQAVLFQGATITGQATADYSFFAPTAPGSYFFRCDVHPTTMTGAFVVVPTVTVTLTAKKMAFDKKTITVPAGAYVTLHFANEDAGVSHNVAVYCCPGARVIYFQGAVITGPQTTDYAFFAPENPGTYFFRCDVHPAQMTGDFVVTAPAG